MLVSIVYDTGYGHTARVAEPVAAGVQEIEGAQAKLIAVADGPMDWEVLEKSDAIIFGSPTSNGLISAKLKQFFEDSTKTAWSDQKWRNKIAAGFTNSGAQHGMIWVGLDMMLGNSSSIGSTDDLNRLGSWLGVMAQSNMDQAPDVAPFGSYLRTAQYLGHRVAESARRFQPA